MALGFTRAVAVASLLATLAPSPPAQSFAVFEEAVAYPGGFPRSLAAGDVNGDGHVDLLVGQSFSAGITKVMKGVGEGEFQLIASIPGSLSVLFQELHDFDGDGDLDLLQSQGKTLLLQLGEDGFGFGAAVALMAGQNSINHRTADVDGDGDLDVLAGVNGIDISPPNGIHVLLNDGAAGFTIVELVSNVDGVAWHDVGDVNEDGVVDVVWCTTNDPTLKYALGEGDGQFGPPRFITSVPLSSLWLLFGARWFGLGDFDDDGHLDVVWLQSLPSQVHVILGDGQGLFSASVPSPAPALHSESAVIVGDVTRDGLTDVLITHPMLGAQLLEGEGDGSFSDDLAIPTGPHLTRDGILTDLDGDGVLDLALIDNDLDEVAVHLNHSYGPGSPFTDLGSSLAKPWSGQPLLLASGAPVAGQTISLDLDAGLPVDTAALILGFSDLSAPFKGGVMVPFPDLILGPLPTDAEGEVLLSATWPALPGGFSFWAQWWMTDSSLTNDFAASTGLRCDVP
jgi:hypothetical protein